MKNINRLPCTLMLLVCIGIGTSLTAQKISLIDINKIKSSNPSNYQNYTGSVFAVLNGNFYFSADDGIHGQELFTSDGTPNGTHLVKDISVGEASANVVLIKTAGSKIYFQTINNATYSGTLWVSDGTEAGTVPVANLPNATAGSCYDFTDVNGSLFFTYNYYNNSGYFQELYKTDASGKNAVLVKSLNGYLQEAVSFNGRFFYSMYDYNNHIGMELYSSDGTTAGTGLVADINPSDYTGSNPVHLTPLNGLLYFAADDGTGNQLWASDGTPAGTYKVKNSNHILLATDGSTGANLLAPANNTIYLQGKVFDGTNSSTGFELCKFNTADPAAEVTLVKDIVPGSTGSMPGAFTNVQGTVFFTAAPNGRPSQLWKTNGTAAGTVLVKDFTDVDPNSFNAFYGFTSVNGKLIFAYSNTTLGSELWKSDGTSAGTLVVKDILPGIEGSGPNDITSANGLTLFSATGTAGNELWRTDGTAPGTVMVKDINTISTADAQPFGFTAINDKVIFGAYSGGNYAKLYINDGTKNGTSIVDSAIRVIQMNFSQKAFVMFKKDAYFFNESNRLCKTNGTKSGTTVLSAPSLVDRNDGFITDLIATDNLLYAIVYSFKTNMTTLWRTDGTKTGTYILKADINANFDAFPVAVGSTLYFANVDNSMGSQLWKTTGTVAGTRIVKTIGSYNYNPLSNLYNFKGKLYFNAYTVSSAAGPVLWQSDGTEAGTIVLKELSVFQQPFGEANGKLFFYASDNVANLGNELYASDGTAIGTKLVKDINPGGGSSFVYSPSSLVSGKKILYFVARKDDFSQQWWKSDGTAAGTAMIKDVVAGPPGTYYNSAINVNDHLYAVTFDNILQESDGTDVTPVNDVILPSLKNITNLFGVGSKLYFSASTYAAGQEVYLGNMGLPATQRVAELATPLVTSRLSLHVSPDPAYTSLQVVCTGLKQNTPATLLLVSPSGAVLKSQQFNGITGTISLDVSSLASGIYFIKVMSGDNTLLSRFIKQ